MGMANTGKAGLLCRWRGVLLAGIWLLGQADASAQESTASQAGIVKVLQGDVHAERSGKSRPLAIGERLYAGDRVVTAAASSVGFTLRDDTLISLGPNSQFLLERFAYSDKTDEGNIAVRLTKGTLRYVSGLIGKRTPENQLLSTPTATIGIRGTDFIVEVPGE
ncbi:FecR domain-containing protein [Herbaspirillum sp. C9C3]|nr:FecR domain-containing protein [Herbaspirillum sp. C7C8]NUT62029.1 FecR domain-containing protein [Herbaspirillum sp. C9C3]